MIAQELFSDEAVERRTGTRIARAKAATRRRRTIARRYRHVKLTILAVATVTVVVVAYLGLLERMTRMNYERAVLVQTRTHLAEQVEKLDDRLLQLDSREHLAALAPIAHFHEAETFAVATVVARPAVEEHPRGLAFFAGWLR